MRCWQSSNHTAQLTTYSTIAVLCDMYCTVHHVIDYVTIYLYDGAYTDRSVVLVQRNRYIIVYTIINYKFCIDIISSADSASRELHEAL